MSRESRRIRLVYGGLLALLTVSMAVVRWDLLSASLSNVLRCAGRGGWPAVWVLAQTLLFLVILAWVFRLILEKPEPRKDLSSVLAALLCGAAAEAWGTRLGLWSYYTGESPPLWILPAWALGTLVVTRAAGELRSRLAPRLHASGIRYGYRLLAGLTLALVLMVARPAWGHPASWLLCAGLGWGLLFRADEQEGFWMLLTGALCVLFADLWGTSSRCWSYHFQVPGSALRQAAGIAFGMFFDAAMVFLAMRTGRWAQRLITTRP